MKIFLRNFHIIYLIFCQIFLKKIVKCNEQNCLKIDQGKVCGKIKETYNNQKYFIFVGIPYAAPPIGNLRFKSPKAPLKWNGTLDASKESPKCPQGYPLEGNEDCLYLNIATTNLTPNNLMPVMVWIHGNGWISSSGSFNEYPPDSLIKENIVLVSINFRLNILGYLKIDDPEFEISGNAGFKDQIEALKWIQKNIKNFGGDPNKVTIFGQSSGATSTNLLLISPLSKNLFHRVIYQSGAATSAWHYDPKLYSKLLRILKCNFKNKFDSFECFNSKNTQEIIEAGFHLIEEEKNQFYLIAAPVVENSSNNSFLPQKIVDLISSKHFKEIPVMAGYCAEETGNYMSSGSIPNFLPNFTDSDVEYLLPRDINLTFGSNEAKQLGRRIKQFYYQNKIPSFDNEDIFIKEDTDKFVYYKVIDSTKRLIQANYLERIYFYKFNIHDFDDTHNKYVTHAAELYFLFNKNSVKTKKTKRNLNRLVKLWTNFAKFGDPTPNTDELLNVKWEPISKQQWNYMEINDDDLKLVNNMENEASIKFWDQVYKNYSKYVLN